MSGKYTDWPRRRPSKYFHIHQSSVFPLSLYIQPTILTPWWYKSRSINSRVWTLTATPYKFQSLCYARKKMGVSNWNVSKGSFRILLQNRLYNLSIHCANVELSVLFYGRWQLLGQKNESTWTPVEKCWQRKPKYSKEILSYCHFIHHET